MTGPCPLCHAEYPSGETCQERFERCLALEFENPGTYGAVHHLTVACYMLQHNRYSREGWLQARALLAEFVKQGTGRIRFAGSIARRSIASSAPGASPGETGWLNLTGLFGHTRWLICTPKNPFSTARMCWLGRKAYLPIRSSF